jgi:hypothetical protein
MASNVLPLIPGSYSPAVYSHARNKDPHGYPFRLFDGGPGDVGMFRGERKILRSTDGLG